jgi:hypothetical protein
MSRIGAVITLGKVVSGEGRTTGNTVRLDGGGPTAINNAISDVSNATSQATVLSSALSSVLSQVTVLGASVPSNTVLAGEASLSSALSTLTADGATPTSAHVSTAVSYFNSLSTVITAYDSATLSALTSISTSLSANTSGIVSATTSLSAALSTLTGDGASPTSAHVSTAALDFSALQTKTGVTAFATLSSAMATLSAAQSTNSTAVSAIQADVNSLSAAHSFDLVLDVNLTNITNSGQLTSAFDTALKLLRGSVLRS